MEGLLQSVAMLLIALGIIALILARGSRQPTLAAILALVSGLTLLLATSRPSGSRVVMIADDDLPDLDGQLRLTEKRANAKRCLVLLRGQDRVVSRPRWQPTCSRAGAGSSPAVAGLLNDAFSYFGQLSWTDQLGDLLAGRSHRVVLLSGPSRLGASAGGILATARLAARARALGVSVDAPKAEGDQEELRTPTLIIEPLQSTAMALTNSSIEQFSFELRIVNSGEPTAPLVSCEFGGSCQSDADCGAAAPRCVRGHCASECRDDAQCRPGGQGQAECVDGACSAASSAEGFRALTPRSVAPLQAEAGFSLGRYRLSDFNLQGGAAGTNLSRGWYPLTCRARFRSGDSTKLVDASSYVLATNDGWAVVWGDGGGIAASPEEKQLATTARDLQLNALIRSTSDLSSLAMGAPPLAESALSAKDKLLPKLTAQAPLNLLLVHDASKAFWQAHCEEITQFLEAGGNVVVSIAPPQVPGCPLPAFSADQPSSSYQDLKPRVTFVLDDSRIGRMAYRAADSPQLEDPASVVQRPLLDGFEDVQLAIVRQVAGALGWDVVGDALRPRTAGATTAPFFGLSTVPEIGVARSRSQQANTAGDMASVSALETRLALVAHETRRLGPEDLVIAFAYAIRTPPQGTNERGRVLGNGARLMVVPIETTFGGAFEKGTDLVALSSSWQPAGDAPYRNEPRLRERVEVATPTGVGSSWGSKPLDLGASDVEALSSQIVRRIRELYSPEAIARLKVRSFHRFIDWRVATSVEQSPKDAALQARPLKLQRLEPNSALRADASQLLTREAAPRQRGALTPMSVAYGAVHGQGHLLVLGYSLFDGAGELPLQDPFRSAVRRLLQGEAATELGGHLFGRLAGKTDRLVTLPTDSPRLQALRTVDRRFLQLDVSQRAKRSLTLDALYLTESGQCSADGVSGAGAASLGLVGIDPKNQRTSFLLSPVQRVRLCNNQACRVSLCRKMCASAANGDCELQSGSADIFLEPASVLAAKPTENLSLSRQLDWLRVLSGGTDAPASERFSPRFASLSRLWAMLAVVAFLAARLLSRRSLLATQQEAGRRDKPSDPSQGLLRGSAEALGLPLPSLPAGAFAGFRPLEAGDSLRSVDRRALLATTLLGNSGLSTIPKVALRIDTSPRSVLVLIDAGACMRIGEGGGEPPKLAAARRVAVLLAELARSLNAQMLVRAVGVAGPPIEAGGINQNLTRREVEAFFDHFEVATHHGHAAMPALPDEAGVSVILVSDFIGKDLASLALEVERVQGEGSPVGIFLISCHTDYTRTQLGWLAGSRTLSDRSHLDVEHLRTIHRAHEARVETVLAVALGGVARVEAEMSDSRLLALILEGSIVELLR